MGNFPFEIATASTAARSGRWSRATGRRGDTALAPCTERLLDAEQPRVIERVPEAQAYMALLLSCSAHKRRPPEQRSPAHSSRSHVTRRRASWRRRRSCYCGVLSLQLRVHVALPWGPASHSSPNAD
jgi:hypothetical protein